MPYWEIPIYFSQMNQQLGWISQHKKNSTHSSNISTKNMASVQYSYHMICIRYTAILTPSYVSIKECAAHDAPKMNNSQKNQKTSWEVMLCHIYIAINTNMIDSITTAIQQPFFLRSLLVLLILASTFPLYGNIVVVREEANIAHTFAHVGLLGVAIGLFF